MHDTGIERDLRALFRDEGDDLPVTITAAELERRLAARQRQRDGRRVRYLAAAVAVIAIGAIGAVANGWLHLPTIAVATSPSATPAAVPGLGRITPTPGGTVLFEVLPTEATTTTRTFHEVLDSTTYVVNVKVMCAGNGAVSFEHDGNTSSTECTMDPTSDPSVLQFPIADAVFDGSYTVEIEPGSVVTILAETVPLPDSLPALTNPGGTVDIDIDVASDSNSPIAGSPDTTVSRTVGRLPEAMTQLVSLVCLGPGAVTFSFEPDKQIEAENVCDGQAEEYSFSVGMRGAQDLIITADARTAWHIIASHEGTLPIFIPPSLFLTTLLADQIRDGPITGETRCGVSYHLADGRSGTEPCSSPAIPDPPDLRSVTVPATGEVRFEMDPATGWVNLDPSVSAWPVGDPARSAPLLFTTDAAGILHVPVSLSEGSYIYRVDLSARDGTATFRAPYFFLVNVEP